MICSVAPFDRRGLSLAGRSVGSPVITSQDYQTSSLFFQRMKYRDLREFLAGLEQLGDLRIVLDT